MKILQSSYLQKVLSFIRGATAPFRISVATGSQSAVEKKDLPTVMVIDDDDIVRELITCAMGDNGRVVEISDGRDIGQIYQYMKPDVVFLDINIPGRDGWKILSDILRTDSKAKVVILSGDSTPENVFNAQQKGAKNFISKPFTSDTIQNNFLYCIADQGQKKN